MPGDSICNRAVIDTSHFDAVIFAAGATEFFWLSGNIEQAVSELLHEPSIAAAKKSSLRAAGVIVSLPLLKLRV